ncbi:MAG: hypothetical protein ABSH10_02235 [Phycisphaerae bacterium]|jgi:hypothetical protein
MGEARDRLASGARPAEAVSHVARMVLVAFIATFVCVRMLVILIMTRAIPDLYVHARGIHIHHLNFGILLLAIVGMWLLFRRPEGVEFSLLAVAYGIGLGLTFDEFGMWLHLGGDYWQRASFDAVVVIFALLALVAFAPELRRFRPHHWITGLILVVLVAAFLYTLVVSFRYVGRRTAPALHHIEELAPY